MGDISLKCQPSPRLPCQTGEAGGLSRPPRPFDRGGEETADTSDYGGYVLGFYCFIYMRLICAYLCLKFLASGQLSPCF